MSSAVLQRRPPPPLTTLQLPRLTKSFGSRISDLEHGPASRPPRVASSTTSTFAPSFGYLQIFGATDKSMEKRTTRSCLVAVRSRHALITRTFDSSRCMCLEISAGHVPNRMTAGLFKDRPNNASSPKTLSRSLRSLVRDHASSPF